ncbi:MAG: oxidoreductase [Thermoleophilia bacterium]|nr:oxidoreductase [Thermoleophilia bacterium]
MSAPSVPRRHRVGIIGAGRLGRALVHALDRAGHEVVAASTRTAASRDLLRRSIDVPTFGDVVEVARRSEVLVCCVPDDALAAIVAQLASELGDADLPDVVVTVSGATALATFAPLVDRGVAAARIHPLQVFTDASGPESFVGVTAAIAVTDPATFDCARSVAESIGLHPVAIDEAHRAAWHAAATIAANYSVTLLAAARDLAVQAGVEEADALASLGALARGAIGRAMEEGPEAALTGPISRGDSGTVDAHLASLEDGPSPELATMYRELGARTVELARRDGRLDVASAARMLRALDHGRVGST